MNIGADSYKACQTRSIDLNIVKLGEILQKTYTDSQKKLQGPPTFRGNPVRIFRGLNFHDAYCRGRGEQMRREVQVPKLEVFYCWD